MNRSNLKSLMKFNMSDTKPSTVWVALVYLLPIMIVIYVVSGRLTESISSSITIADGIISIGDDYYRAYYYAYALINAFFLIYSLITAGFKGYCLRISRGQSASFGNLFDHIGRPLRFFGLWICAALATLPVTLVDTLLGGGSLGFVISFVCMLATIYINFGFSQSVFVAIDRPDDGILACMRESWTLMRGRRGEYFVLQLSFLGWMIVSVLIFPLFYTVPYMQTTLAGYYNMITDWADDNSREAHGEF